MTHLRTLTFDPAKWRPEKPAKEGAYYVKGFHLGHPEDRVLVEVREVDGELCSNMHDVDNWWPIADHSSRFLWLGPLVPEAAAPEPPELSTVTRYFRVTDADAQSSETVGVKVPKERAYVRHSFAKIDDYLEARKAGEASGWNSCIDEVLRLNAEQAKAEPAAGVSELLKDCYYNLEGVIMDAEREGLDAVCLKTIKYVQGQITKARLAARGK